MKNLLLIAIIILMSCSMQIEEFQGFDITLIDDVFTCKTNEYAGGDLVFNESIELTMKTKNEMSIDYGKLLIEYVDGVLIYDGIVIYDPSIEVYEIPDNLWDVLFYGDNDESIDCKVVSMNDNYNGIDCIKIYGNGSCEITMYIEKETGMILYYESKNEYNKNTFELEE